MQNGFEELRRSAIAGSVLLVTADVVRAGRLAHALTQSGLLVTVAFESRHALSSVRDVDVQVVVWDLAASEQPLAELRAMRRVTAAPVLGLLSMGMPPLEQLFATGVAAVAHVDVGAEQLATQTLALIGLVDPCQAAPRERTTWGLIELDHGRRVVRVQGRAVAVTPLQFRLLSVLVAASGDVVSHDALYRLLWRSRVDDDGQRLAAHISRLRDRLGGARGAGGAIVTVRGAGYRMADVGDGHPTVALAEVARPTEGSNGARRAGREPVHVVALPELNRVSGSG